MMVLKACLLVVISSPIIRVEPLTCLQCINVPQPRHCDIVSTCGSDEMCGVEKTNNSFGDVLYNVGCMQKSKCQSTKNTNHCIECCSSDLCNAKGCGEIGYPQNTGPVCYNCPLHTNRKQCHNIDICGIGEICTIDARLEFGDLVLSSKCSDVHACRQAMVSGTHIVGRDLDHISGGNGAETRSLREHVCHTCCDSDLCNRNCSGGATQRPCDSTPCAHGICHEEGSAFYCKCNHGYSGKYCDVAMSVCIPNPCVHGKCFESANGYSCQCTTGFNGSRCEIETVKGIDCYDILQKNASATSGVYKISLWRSHTVLHVVCDMDTDNGGWTVFQRRIDGSVEFFRIFSEYENGFGTLAGEFWLGLKYVEEMTKLNISELRLDLTAANGSQAYEVFRHFSLGAGSGYTLHIDQGVGTAGDWDGLSYSKNRDFSAYDRNDHHGCATRGQGGWWFYRCSYTNLNARYLPPGTPIGDAGFEYYDFMKEHSLKESKMMFRRMHI